MTVCKLCKNKIKNKKNPSVIRGDHLGQGFVFMYLNLSSLTLKRMRKFSILLEVSSLLLPKDVGILVGNNFCPKKKIKLKRTRADASFEWFNHRQVTSLHISIFLWHFLPQLSNQIMITTYTSTHMVLVSIQARRQPSVDLDWV